MNQSEAQPLVVPRLCVMMFLQFFVWGAWFGTLGLCLGSNKLTAAIADAYGSAPIAAIIAPLFLGLVADRFFSSERVMAVLFLLGGVCLCAIPYFGNQGKAGAVVWLSIAHMLCYMPTLGLGNSIAFANITDQTLFPKIRVWGTIGWIVAGLVVGFAGWSAKFNIFYLAGGGALLLGVFCFFLPHTPPPAKDQPVNLKAIFMIDALKLLIQPAFLIFMTCSMLICIPLAYYYAFIANYLNNTGFPVPASTMTLGQMSEIFFMLLIPFFFRRLGFKIMILIGMAAWVGRYLLFAFGAADQTVLMILMGVVLHGICYDFFFVMGFMYTEKKAKPEIRSQAQSMLVFFTQGIGMFIGYKIAGNRFGATMTKYEDLTGAIGAARGEQELSFLDKLLKMFTNDLPAALDPALLSETMAQWKTFWILPAIMAAAVLVIFAAAFWDRSVKDDAKKTEDQAS